MEEPRKPWLFFNLTIEVSMAESALKLKLSELMKSSMKSGDKETLGTIRMLHAAIRKKEIDDKIECDDSLVGKIAQTMIKQRHEAIAQFKTGNRQDLVDKETKEITVLSAFLPLQLSQDELVKIIESAIQESGAKSAKDMGLVMKVLMPQVTGKADGKLVNQLVRDRLP